MSPDIDVYFYDFCEIIKQYRKQFIESIDQRLLKLDKVNHVLSNLKKKEKFELKSIYFKIYSFQNSHRLHLQKHLLFSIVSILPIKKAITVIILYFKI